jgi:hypothetical protein
MLVTVTAPVPELTVMLLPAATLVTPRFCTVTDPDVEIVGVETEKPEA